MSPCNASAAAVRMSGAWRLPGRSQGVWSQHGSYEPWGRSTKAAKRGICANVQEVLGLGGITTRQPKAAKCGFSLAVQEVLSLGGLASRQQRHCFMGSASTGKRSWCHTKAARKSSLHGCHDPGAAVRSVGSCSLQDAARRAAISTPQPALGTWKLWQQETKAAISTLISRLHSGSAQDSGSEAVISTPRPGLGRWKLWQRQRKAAISTLTFSLQEVLGTGRSGSSGRRQRFLETRPRCKRCWKNG